MEPKIGDGKVTKTLSSVPAMEPKIGGGKSLGSVPAIEPKIGIGKLPDGGFDF